MHLRQCRSCKSDNNNSANNVVLSEIALLKVKYVFCTCVVVGFTVSWLGTVCVMIVVGFPDAVS